jgi:hypothetical protein
MEPQVMSENQRSNGFEHRNGQIMGRIIRSPRVACCSALNMLYQTGILGTQGLTLPHFLGIGAQKAGSTWLYENLRCHPDVFLPDTKDLKYFSRNFHESLRGYSRNFAASNGRVVGDICTSYSILPQERIRFIRRVMPDARILVVLRNPIERAWSFANMQLVRDSGRRLQDVSDSEFISHFRKEGSRGHGDYRSLLERWFYEFPEDQVWIGFFDEIAEQPRVFLTNVFDFLGVRTEVNWESFPYQSVVNAGPKAPIPDRLRDLLEEMYGPTLDWLRKRFGDQVQRWTIQGMAGQS